MDLLVVLSSLLVPSFLQAGGLLERAGFATVSGVNPDDSEKKREGGATKVEYTTQVQDKKTELRKRLLDKIAGLIERADAGQLERLDEIVDKLAERFPPARAESTRSYVGFYMASLDEWEKDMLAKHGIKGGVKVGQIMPGSPAEKAGLKPGDIILSVSLLGDSMAASSVSMELAEFDDLTRFLDEKCKPYDRVRFSVMRDGSIIDVHVTLGEDAELTTSPFPDVFPRKPAGGRIPRLEKKIEMLTKLNEKLRNIIRRLKNQLKSIEEKRLPRGQNTGRPYIGIRVSELDEDDLLRTIDHAYLSGMKITSVENGSPAQKAGLAQRDIIVSINQKTIETFEDIEAILRSARPGDQLTVKAIRIDGAVTTLTVTLEGRK